MRRAIKEPTPPAGGAQALSFKLDELTAPMTLDLELAEELLARFLSDAGSEFRADGSGRLTGQLAAVDAGALLRAEVRCRVLADCNRCLAPVAQDLAFPVMVRYVPREKLEARTERSKDSPTGEKAGSFDIRDLDEEPLDKRRVDIQPAVREQLLLALPMGAVCREDCKGLCGNCGKALNEGPCDCKPTVDPRWSQLEDLKLKN